VCRLNRFSSPRNHDPPRSASFRGTCEDGPRIERVDGIGGFFFKAADPDGLAAWYEQHLGIDPVPTSYGGNGVDPA
jgi:hypothetical protein